MNNIYYFFILIILSILFYYTYTFFLKNKNEVHNILYKDTLYLYDDVNTFVSIGDLPKSVIGRQYSYSFWIYIKNIPSNGHFNSDFRTLKPIIYRYGSPNIYYNAVKHEIVISLKYRDIDNYNEFYNFNLEDIPIQKWNNIIIVCENKNIKIYLDGKFKTANKLPNVPIISNKNLYIGEEKNNFNGHIHRIEYFNYPISKNTIQYVYNYGLNTLPSNLPTYKDKFLENKTN